MFLNYFQKKVDHGGLNMLVCANFKGIQGWPATII